MLPLVLVIDSSILRFFDPSILRSFDSFDPDSDYDYDYDYEHEHEHGVKNPDKRVCPEHPEYEMRVRNGPPLKLGSGPMPRNGWFTAWGAFFGLDRSVRV